MKAKKVFVGLSGGVDSAVSAALLKKEGYDVTGVFITIAIAGYPCPAAEDRISAMRVAAHLDIPFLEVNLSKEYEQEVFRPSIEEWRKGRTPNPDTLCNEKIKFGIFFDWCISRDADFVATGHYAQLVAEKPASQRSSDLLAKGSARPFAHQVSPTHLLMGEDENKDQTYFLWAVPENKLKQTLFPIGHLQKSEVRVLADKLGLPNAKRPDSQGLCFLGDISLDDMLQHELGLTPGSVLDENGEVVGTHRGAALYTQGQRHGFDLHASSPDTQPHFVSAKDVAANTITVSSERVPSQEASPHLLLTDTNWIGKVEDGPCMARFRYRQPLMPATLVRVEGEEKVLLGVPERVPVGQSLVLYRDNRCLGGGVISATL